MQEAHVQQCIHFLEHHNTSKLFDFNLIIWAHTVWCPRIENRFPRFSWDRPLKCAVSPKNVNIFNSALTTDCKLKCMSLGKRHYMARESMVSSQTHCACLSQQRWLLAIAAAYLPYCITSSWIFLVMKIPRSSVLWGPQNVHSGKTEVFLWQQITDSHHNYTYMCYKHTQNVSVPYPKD